MTKTNKTLMTAALGGFMLAATLSAASAEETKATAPASGENTGECHGMNACKATGACRGVANTCAGKNACKGQGWSKTTKAECDAKGGKFEEKKG